jgi:hypothetical protein
VQLYHGLGARGSLKAPCLILAVGTAMIRNKSDHCARIVLFFVLPHIWRYCTFSQ